MSFSERILGGAVGVLNAGRFTAHDLEDGSERFWLDQLPTNVIATPVASGGTLFLSVAGGQGEVDNLQLPPPFDELVARYDRNKDLSLIHI